MAPPPARTAVGFVGIGNMGWPMAADLVRGDHDVLIYDIDQDRADRFVDEYGGERAASLAEVGASVDHDEARRDREPT
jgi:3-hydroxyisobutyrate dehydrogenase